MREKIARAHDENLDDQEVELLDESTQPNTEYLVCGHDAGASGDGALVLNKKMVLQWRFA